MVHRLELPPRALRAVITLFLVALVLGAVNLLFTAHEVNSVRHQFAVTDATGRRQGELVEQKLCASFGRLAALQPPAGNPETNPSRGYLQAQHQRLDELGADLGCERAP